jgi:hypothetical protein
VRRSTSEYHTAVATNLISLGIDHHIRWPSTITRSPVDVNVRGLPGDATVSSAIVGSEFDVTSVLFGRGRICVFGCIEVTWFGTTTSGV